MYELQSQNPFHFNRQSVKLLLLLNVINVQGQLTQRMMRLEAVQTEKLKSIFRFATVRYCNMNFFFPVTKVKLERNNLRKKYIVLLFYKKDMFIFRIGNKDPSILFSSQPIPRFYRSHHKWLLEK